MTITTLFMDIGGVLLTNGWDRKTRALAALAFHLDPDDIEERHHLTYDTYEECKLNLEEYLQRVNFYQPRPFSMDDFKSFMLSRSQPIPEMIDLTRSLKEQYHLKVVAVSNEGREINAYRIHPFGLDMLIDTFVSSCFVHYRKPDLDISQSLPDEVAYIDDRPLFIEVANSIGIHSLQHVDAQSTRALLEQLGLILH
jgi:putative hydrolase of the HAD superfamily